MSRWVTADYVPYKRADAVASRAAMQVGVPKEAAPGERRVALVPETIGRLGEGVEVVVEQGAGVEAGFADAAYTEAGATIGDPWGCDVIVKVAAPSEVEAARLRDGQVLVAFLAPLTDTDGVARLDGRRRARARARVDPADHACAADGRAVVAGDGQRVQGRRSSPPTGCRGSCRC